MKNTNNETKIFHANRVLKIPNVDCRIFLLNMQAIIAIEVHIDIANSLVEKLSKSFSIDKIMKPSICRLSYKVSHILQV